jgi:glycosyltransferase involved in cell wall biosynthesis
MKIAVNAVNLSSAGGLTVALNFIKCFQEKAQKNLSLVVFTPKNVGYEQYADDLIEIISLPKSWNSKVMRLFVDYFWLPNQIKKSKADVIFTMGNFAVPSKLPQGVLFMWPYAIYPEEPIVWDLMSRKDRIIRKLRLKAFKSRLKYADKIFPQTETSKGRLQKYYSKLLREIDIVPMAYSTIGMDTKKPKIYFEQDENIKYLLCLTRYYEHKNVEVFLSVGKLIKEKAMPYKIVSTIGADQHPKALKFIEDIRKEGLEDIIINIGRVPITDVPSLYNLTDGCILPTLLESFSATYVDSMNFGKPIFTSNRDFAADACQDAAYYFDPYDAKDILETIDRAFNNKSEMFEKVEYGKKRIASMPDWNKVSEFYLELLSDLVVKDK